MLRRLLPCLVLLAVAAPLAARADGSVAINARAGVAKPFGEAAKGSKLADEIAWGFPLQADLQFRFTKRFSAGAYVRYALTSLDADLKSACDATGISCSASDLAFGGLFEYRFGERMEGGPWIGALVGYEMQKSTGPAPTAGAPVKSTMTLKGFEAGAQVGYDFELGGVTLGPWIQANAGQFSNYEWKAGSQSASGTISDKAIHGWISAGIRLSLLL